MEAEKQPLKCFISYAHAHKDHFDVFLEDFKANTANLRDVELDIWTDEKIPLGSNWHQEIQEQIANCNLAILLVSDKFMTSEYIKHEEVARLFERQKKGNILVIPVYFYSCRFNDWPELAENQFFKPQGADYGCANRDKRNRFCYADLIKFHNTKGVNIPQDNQNRTDYMMDFVDALEPHFKKLTETS